MEFADLNQTHPEYEGELWERLRLLYKGGYELLEHAREFIPRLPNEGAQRYEYRLRHASYVPYFAQIVGYLVGALFHEPLQVAPSRDTSADPFYPSFSKDADLTGRAFALVAQQAVAEALVYKRSLVCVDLPPAVEALSRAEEDALGAGRAYCYNTPISSLLDWGRDKTTGKLSWCILRSYHHERESPTERRETYRYRFTVWTLAGGIAHWETWQTAPIKLGEAPKGNVEVEQTGNGVTSFREIPVLELAIPDELWLGNKIGPLTEEHFRKRSELEGGLAESNVELPVLYLGSEIPAVGGALPAEVQQDPHRGDDLVTRYQAQGYVILGGDDKLEFAGPNGRAFELTNTKLAELRDEIHRVPHTMALSLANTAGAVGRSGESKREDRSATEIVLSYLASFVRDFGTDVFKCISDSRGEKIAWAATGLDVYDVDEAEGVAAEAADVQMLDIPSPTFRREYLTRVAMRLVRNAEPETKTAIQAEINQAIPDEPI